LDETKKQGKHIVFVYYSINHFGYNSTHGFGIKGSGINLIKEKQKKMLSDEEVEIFGMCQFFDRYGRFPSTKKEEKIAYDIAENLLRKRKKEEKSSMEKEEMLDKAIKNFIEKQKREDEKKN